VVLQVRLGQVLLDRVQQLELQEQERSLQCNFEPNYIKRGMT
jgi:hypothetical protein